MAPTALFRVEGTLLHRSPMACAAWFAAHQADPSSRWHKVGRALSAPRFARWIPGGGDDRSQRWMWSPLEGCSEDRWLVLSEQWWEEATHHLNTAGWDLVAQCQRQGYRIVLLSSLPRQVLGNLAQRLEADELLCNDVVLEHGELTGQLVQPLLPRRLDATWLHRFARERGLEPSEILAYGSKEADNTLLSAVTRPCAVTPDAALRRLAVSLGWPIVEG